MTVFKHSVVFRTELKKINKLEVPPNAIMAVVTMSENYALITFYDLLERIITIIELTKEELEAVYLHFKRNKTVFRYAKIGEVPQVRNLLKQLEFDKIYKIFTHLFY